MQASFEMDGLYLCLFFNILLIIANQISTDPSVDWICHKVPTVNRNDNQHNMMIRPARAHLHSVMELKIHNSDLTLTIGLADWV